MLTGERLVINDIKNGDVFTVIDNKNKNTYRHEFYFQSSDANTQIHAIRWIPEGEIKGVVQIVHGIAEYAKRYEDFALFLNSHGFAVVSHDHKGHGLSVSNNTRLYIGVSGSWWNVVKDVYKLQQISRNDFSDVSYFMFGHSMGSFIVRCYLIKNLSNMDGCILSGTGSPGKLEVTAGRCIIKIISRFKGSNAYSKLVDNLIFGKFNHYFKNENYEAAWVSKSKNNIKKYLEDPLCGGKVTLGLFSELLYGSLFSTKSENINKMDKIIPILLISGEDDPVGNMSKGVKKTYAKYKKSGIQDVKMILYPNLRHEILNEEGNDKIYCDILEWLNSKIK